MEKICTRCKKPLAIEYYGVDNSRPDKHTIRCRKCENLSKRELTKKRREDGGNSVPRNFYNKDHVVGWNSDAEIFC